MISFRLPSINKLLPWGDRVLFTLPSVKIHEIDTALEKPARALKHLLKLNHANHAILYNERRFHNHAPHVRPLLLTIPKKLLIRADPLFIFPARSGRR